MNKIMVLQGVRDDSRNLLELLTEAARYFEMIILMLDQLLEHDCTNQSKVININAYDFMRPKSYITWVIVDNVDRLLVAKMLPQAIRSKYDKLVFRPDFVYRYWWFWAKDRLDEGLRQSKPGQERLSVELCLLKICVTYGSWNLQRQRKIISSIYMRWSIDNGLGTIPHQCVWHCSIEILNPNKRAASHS